MRPGLTPRPRLQAGLILLALLIVLPAIAMLMGPDGNYDLRNYHFYNGWALFNKPVGYDIAPAQIQTWFHPLLDGIFYQLWRVLNPFPLLFTATWAVPQAMAVWFLFLAARPVFAADGLMRLPLALGATVIAAGGAASVGVLGTSMSDGVPNMLVFAGIWLVLRDLREGYATDRLAGAGVLVGVAIGLKLTMACYGLGFAAAMVLAPGMGDWRLRIRRAVVFGVASTVALAAVGAPWWWALYRTYGSPLFPFYNAWFHSPDYGDWNWADARFLPKTLFDWLFYPWEWMVRKSRSVSEEPVRDLREGVALLASLALLLARVVRTPGLRPNPAAVWCAIWILASYPAWLMMFSIVRYASGLEVMSGLVIVAALSTWAQGWTAPLARAVAGAAVAVLMVATTVYPTWERHKNMMTSLLSVGIRQVPPDSLVMYLAAVPASYVAAFEPPSVRFVGVNNSIITLDATYGLQRRVEDAIRTARGPIWEIEKTDTFPGKSEESMARYGLRRTDECSPIASNQDYWLRICRMERTREVSAGSPVIR